MIEIRTAISIKEAIQKTWNYRKLGKKEKISIHNCDYRRLAEPIIALNNVPSFNKSPYDGFTLHADDTKNASSENPIEFEIVEHIAAGEVAKKTLQSGQAARIMTGAKIPEGANCVAMFEDCQSVEKDNKEYMSIQQPMGRNHNIIQEGSEVEKGTILIPEGTFINPGVKALLATFGYSEVEVAKKPIVGVIATGTELLDVDDELTPGKIRDSNGYMLSSQVIQAGGEYKDLGKLADQFEPSYNAIKDALNEVDILITTGGVSVGDFDLMPTIYEKLGAKVLFNKVAIRPASVTTVAVKDDQLLFGLSGNPSACYVGFELFARPIIQHLLFNKRPFLQRIEARLAKDFSKTDPFTRFVRGYLTFKDGSVFANLSGMDQSNVVTSLAHATVLIEIPEGSQDLKRGDSIDVRLLGETEGQASFYIEE